jgi:hypothetical protein
MRFLLVFILQFFIITNINLLDVFAHISLDSNVLAVQSGVAQIEKTYRKLEEKELLISIVQKMDDLYDAKVVCSAFKVLVEKGIITGANFEERKNSVEEFLISISNAVGKKAVLAYNTLRVLVEKGIITEANFEKRKNGVKELLISITANREDDWQIMLAYSSLEVLAKERVITEANFEKRNFFLKLILTNELLISMLSNVGKNAVDFYNILEELIEQKLINFSDFDNIQEAVRGILCQQVIEMYRLKKISFKDCGDNINNIYKLIKLVFVMRGGSEEGIFDKNKEEDVICDESRDIEIDTMYKDGVEDLIKGYTFWKALGRTLLFKHDVSGSIKAIKLRKDRESMKTLEYEAKLMAKLSKCEELDFNITSGGEVFLISKEELTDYKDSLGEQIEQSGNAFSLYEKDNFYQFIVYEVTGNKEVSAESYFEYLENMDNLEKFKQASIRNFKQLVLLAKERLFHTALINLYHNLNNNRKYIWPVDIVQVQDLRHGTGRLHSVVKSAKYSNMRRGGIMDFAEMKFFRKAIEEKIELRSGDGDLFNSDSKSKDLFYLMNFLGEYYLSWVLILGRNLSLRGQFDLEEKERLDMLKDLEKLLEEVFVSFYAFLIDLDEVKIKERLKTINFRGIAEQMEYFMSYRYVEGIRNKNIPQGIYADDVEIEYPDFDAGLPRGWRVLQILDDKGIVFEEKDIGWMLKMSNLKYVKDKLGINIKEEGNYFIVKQEELKSRFGSVEEGINRIKQELREYKDLGTGNGSFPLQELISALYIGCGSMVLDFVDQQNKAKEEVGIAA